MAKVIQAITAYRPRIILRTINSTLQVCRHIAERTGLTRAEVRMVLDELNAAAIYYGARGEGMRLEGMGTFYPVISVPGIFKMKLRMNISFSRALNIIGAFTGDIVNRENIGKTRQEFIEMYNLDHPDDLVEA